MQAIHLFLLCVVGIIVGFAGQVDGGDSTLNHVHFIQQNINYLFRGGEPKNSSNVFVYNELVSEMRQAAKAEGNITLPQSFYLIDICLLTPFYPPDREDIEMETKWFEANKAKGRIFQYTILGEEVDPISIRDSPYLPELAKTFDRWGVDKLPSFVETVHEIVLNKTNPPTVSYIHCECGCDRTGEVSGAYYMRYMGMTLHDVHEINFKIAGREVEKPSRNALEWYCFYLKYDLNYNLTCEP